MGLRLQIMFLLLATLAALLSFTDSKAIKQVTSATHKKCCITEYGPVVPMSLEEVVRMAAKKSISSVIDAGADLSELKDHFIKEQKSLKGHLEKARAMAAEVKKKIKGALDDTTKILNEALKKARGKLEAVKDAAKELGDVEMEVGTTQTKAKAVEVREEIEKHPNTKESKLEKDVLSENGVIATLDAAKIIAEAAAEKKEKAKEVKNQKLIQEAKAIEDAMTTAEKKLNDETAVEMKDENDAKQKIKDAVKHNKKAVKNASKFLENIEKSINKFQQDVKALDITQQN